MSLHCSFQSLNDYIFMAKELHAITSIMSHAKGQRTTF